MSTASVEVRGRDRAAKLGLYAVLILGMILVVGPFLWMVVSAVKRALMLIVLGMLMLPGMALFVPQFVQLPVAAGRGHHFGLLLAGSTVVVLPVLIVFLMLQRHSLRGIATTGLK